jgi:hypothetical protein
MSNKQQKGTNAPRVSRIARVAGGVQLNQANIMAAELAAEKNMESIILKERHITIGLTSVLLVVVIVLCSLGLATYSMYNKSLPSRPRNKLTLLTAYVQLFRAAVFSLTDLLRAVGVFGSMRKSTFTRDASRALASGMSVPAGRAFAP